MAIHRLFRFLILPVIAGLVAAAALLYIYPELSRPAPENQESPLIMPSDNDWTGPVSYRDAVQKAGPSVVNIYTTKMVRKRSNPLLEDELFRRLFNIASQPRRGPEYDLGSGVIISADGYILTNFHVVEGAEQILVQLQDGREANARIIGSDEELDLTVLRIQLPDLNPIDIGDSELTQVGDVVLAIGNPYGVGQTVTQGIISAVGRTGLTNNPYESFLQTDASINMGNSGGALVNVDGELMGINTLIFNHNLASGISFAVPIHAAIKSFQDIIQYGRVIRGYLGIGEVIRLTPAQAQQYNLGTVSGLWVASVVEGSPADKAGIQKGDIISRINQKKVLSMEFALNLISNTRPGTEITIEVVRNGETVPVTATIGEAPPRQK